MNPVVFVETWYNDPLTNTITRIRTSPSTADVPVPSPTRQNDTPRIVTVVPELTWNDCAAKDGLEVEVSTIRKHTDAVESERIRKCGCIML